MLLNSSNTVPMPSTFQKAEDQDIQNKMFSFDFHDCETWSLTLREDQRLQMV